MNNTAQNHTPLSVFYYKNSILVQGSDTKLFKDVFKQLHGVWNSNLRAWVFSLSNEQNLMNYLNQYGIFNIQGERGHGKLDEKMINNNNINNIYTSINTTTFPQNTMTSFFGKSSASPNQFSSNIPSQYTGGFSQQQQPSAFPPQSQAGAFPFGAPQSQAGAFPFGASQSQPGAQAGAFPSAGQPSNFLLGQSSNFPPGVQQSQSSNFPPGVQQSQSSNFPPAGQSSNFPPGVQQSQPSAFPPGVQQSQPSAFPPGVQQSQPSAFPPGVQPSNFPSGAQQSQPSAFPGQPSNFPPGAQQSQPSAFPGQPSAFPGQPSAFPGQPSAFPSGGQPSAFPSGAAQSQNSLSAALSPQSQASPALSVPTPTVDIVVKSEPSPGSSMPVYPAMDMSAIVDVLKQLVTAINDLRATNEKIAATMTTMPTAQNLADIIEIMKVPESQQMGQKEQVPSS